jgi:hypothetical protein
MGKSLTDAQIENWRIVLIGMFGPYANIMPREDIETYVENLNKHLNDEKVKR